MDKKDLTLTKQIRSYFIKNDLDISCATILVQYGVCQVYGKISKIPKTNVPNVQLRAEQVSNIIKKIPGIQEVVYHCVFQEEMFK